MGDKFIGSEDYILVTDGAITGTITEGAWVDILEAKMHELVITIADLSGETMTVKLESEIAGGVYEIYSADYTSNQSATADLKVSLGGIPGGRRIRYTAEMAGVEEATLTAVLKETRSGLG